MRHRSPLSARRFLVGLALALTGCGACTVPLPCDVRDHGCQQISTAYIACLLDGDPNLAVEARTITPEQYAAELRSSIGEPDEIYEQHSAALALMELVTPAGTMTEEWIEHTVANARAVYSADIDRITIIDHGTPLDDETALWILLHELVHAFQDAAVDLVAFDRDFGTTTDSTIAARSAIEGGAVYYTNMAQVDSSGLEIADIDWDGYYDEWQADLDLALDDDPSPMIAGQWGFPYAYGGDYIRQAWEHGGNDAVWGCYDPPPGSTAEVMNGYGSTPETDPVDGVLTLSGSLDGFHPTGWRTMGRWLLYVFARLLTDNLTAVVLTRDWVGDRLWTFADAGGRVALVWLIRWSSHADRSRELVDIVGAAGRPAWKAWASDRGGDAILVAADEATSLDDWLTLGRDAL